MEMNDIELVDRMLDELFFKNQTLKCNLKNDLLYKFMRNDLPYCIQTYKDKKGKNKTLFLNREYKPIGVFGYKPSVNYEPFLEFRGFYGIDEILIYDEKYWGKQEKLTYFYNDGNSPFSEDKKDLVYYLFFLKMFILFAKIKQGIIDNNKAFDEGFFMLNDLLNKCKYKSTKKEYDYFWKHLETLREI
jgi:hypothetical protein